MMLVELVDHPLARAGTLALLHFLWQGVLIAAGLAAAVDFLGIRRTSWRYACSLAALVLMAAMPLATVVWLIRSPSGSMISHAASELTPARMSMSISAWQPAGVVVRAQPYILAMWTTGVAFFSCRLLLGVIGVRQLRRDRVPLPRELANRIERFESQLRMSTHSLVFLSYRVSEAIAVGLVRPIVLIPAAWATEMPPALLEAIIAHELAHLRRWDVWINVLQRIVEAILFYHPAVWWLSRRMRIEREFCCDELAVNLTGRRLEYVQALETVARREARVEPLFAASIRGEKHMRILQRVRNVLGMSSVDDRSRFWPAGLLALLLPLGAWVGTAGLVSADSSIIAACDDEQDDDDDDDKPTAKQRERDEDDDDDRPAAKRGRDEDDDDDKPGPKKASRNDDDNDKPATKRGGKERDDDDKPAPKKASRNVDDDDKPATKRGGKERDDDGKPAPKKASRNVDDDDKPATKRGGKERDDDDKPAPKKVSRNDDDDDDKPAPKKVSRNVDDQGEEKGSKYPADKVENPKVLNRSRIGGKKYFELKGELNPKTISKEPIKTMVKPNVTQSELKEYQYEGDKRIDELKAMVEKLMAENKRLRAELDELRGDEGRGNPEAQSYRKEVEGLYRRRAAAAVEKGEAVLKRKLAESAVQKDKELLEKKLKQAIDEKEEGAIRERKHEEAAGRHLEALQLKLKSAIAEKEEAVSLERKLKELDAQNDKIVKEQQVIEALERKVQEERKRAEKE